MAMDETSKQKAMQGRDCFNEWISPLRGTYPLIKEIQDVMNNAINRVINDDPNPYVRCRERLQSKNLVIKKWRDKYQDCMKKKPKPEPPKPKPSKAIKSLTVRKNTFLVNGKPTKLYGVSKREMIAVGSGDYPQSKVNYTYKEIKTAILSSNINYIRVLAGKNLGFFRKEVKDYLSHGINVEVELFDAGEPNRAWQAHWKNTFNAVEDLPVFFDAHNEFLELNVVDSVRNTVEYVTSNGGIISAGAWSGATGKKLAAKFKKKCTAYQIVSHHRDWTARSLVESMESGKPIIMNEIHTRDISLQRAKDLFKFAFNWGCVGVNIYSLLNWGIGAGSNFQKILDYVSEFRHVQT